MVWWEQDEPAGELGVVLPGAWFGCAPPPTAYATEALLARGADVAWLNWSFDRDPEFGRLDEAARWERPLQHARSGLDAALGRHPRGRWVIAGKSLGTWAMAKLWEEGRVPERARTTWLTPLLRDPAVRAALEALARPGLVVIGDHDPHLDPAFLEDLRARDVCEVLLLEGANHGLNVYGDLPATARTVARYLDALATFLDRDP